VVFSGVQADAMNPDRRDGPVAAATADLVAWLRDAVGAPVRIGPPTAIESGDAVVAAWPLELRGDQEARGTGERLPMRLILRCLVCASGAVDDATRLLDRVLVASAAAVGRFVVFEPPPADTWLAFGVAPRPAVLFDIPLQIERTTPSVPMVRQPLQVQAMSLVALQGRLVGPGDIPLSDMRVELASTGHSTQTDSNGQFVLAGVPAGEPARLRVRGRGRYLLAEVETPSTDPVVIHCTIEEA
jgi:hypothetical protein